MTKKLTPWFPGTVAPVHVGVYERQVGSEIYYSKWDGLQWLLLWEKLEMAEAEIDRSVYALQDPDIKWRGFTTPQGESK